jgi:hypothetical protein
MSLPDEIGASITIDGLSFDLRVRALPKAAELLFPSQECVYEFRISPDLQLAAAQAAASALDAAVWKFQEGFQLSLSKVLSDLSEKNKEAA